jgi:hypothetical protein
MNILTQQLSQDYPLSSSSALAPLLDKLISPLDYYPNCRNYVELISTLGNTVQAYTLERLRRIIEEMDYKFRHSPGRKQRYYVKQSRERTLTTIYGEFTYRRTEYIDRYDNRPFCYVDRKLGIRNRERFDAVVQSLIIEAYADHNSMIKVGKIIGDRISSPFNIQASRDTAISRQTVYNILHRFKSIQVPIIPRAHTPDTLYIMADEKFIALQRELQKRAKQMVKAAVIFEGKELEKRNNGTLTARNRLINKTIVTETSECFWEKVDDILHQTYDMSKVKRIVIMGDGASWIKNGVNELKQRHIKVVFAIDVFHFLQAINFITSNDNLRSLLGNYAYNNAKDDFHSLVSSIIEQEPQRKKTIKQYLTYIMNNWRPFQIMTKQVRIGCAMEQAISHILASVFTSVPKAYTRKNLEVYLNYRTLLLNTTDFRNIILTAMSVEAENSKDVIIPKQEFDFSIFEKKHYKNEIHFLNKVVYTKF